MTNNPDIRQPTAEELAHMKAWMKFVDQNKDEFPGDVNTLTFGFMVLYLIGTYIRDPDDIELLFSSILYNFNSYVELIQKLQEETQCKLN